MGNCGYRIKKRKEKTDGNVGGASNGEQDLNGKTSKEEVLYATIDHGDADRQRTVVNNDDDGCDYAVINIPSGPAQKAAIREDCTDDYVLMS